MAGIGEKRVGKARKGIRHTRHVRGHVVTDREENGWEREYKQSQGTCPHLSLGIKFQGQNVCVCVVCAKANWKNGRRDRWGGQVGVGGRGSMGEGGG